jgi:fido (protein-threonine AMPylation protein)
MRPQKGIQLIEFIKMYLLFSVCSLWLDKLRWENGENPIAHFWGALFFVHYMLEVKWGYELSDAFTLKEILTIGIGLMGGLAVALYVYVRQQKDSTITHSEIVAALERIYEQQLKDGNSSQMQSICTISNEVEGLSDLVEIKEKIDESLSALKAIRKGQEPSPDDVLRYKMLGDKWSELVSASLDLRIIDEQGIITVPRLLAVHKSTFPDEFPWAGKYRTQHVYVVDNFGTAVKIVDAVQAQSKAETIPPESIEDNLNKLLSYWNENVNSIATFTPENKINEVTNFHHEFELIHPFLDGNGRIGRMLLGEQLSYLFKTKILFNPDRDDYYKALRIMNMGHNDILRGLVSKELEKFNVDL